MLVGVVRMLSLVALRDDVAGTPGPDTHRTQQRRSSHGGDRPGAVQGQVESLWVAEQLGRPLVKAWNAITARSVTAEAAVAGSRDRLALPAAAADDADRALGMFLLEDTGFDGCDAGRLLSPGPSSR
jgi:predicted dinucleotide-binding enzyme